MLFTHSSSTNRLHHHHNVTLHQEWSQIPCSKPWPIHVVKGLICFTLAHCIIVGHRPHSSTAFSYCLCSVDYNCACVMYTFMSSDPVWLFSFIESLITLSFSSLNCRAQLCVSKPSFYSFFLVLFVCLSVPVCLSVCVCVICTRARALSVLFHLLWVNSKSKAYRAENPISYFLFTTSNLSLCSSVIHFTRLGLLHTSSR